MFQQLAAASPGTVRIHLLPAGVQHAEKLRASGDADHTDGDRRFLGGKLARSATSR